MEYYNAKGIKQIEAMNGIISIKQTKRGTELLKN